MIISFLLYLYIFEEHIKRGYKIVLFQLVIIFLLIFITYSRFAPLTYYLPISATDFEKLEWFPIWGLKAV
jgi:dolichyl-phosphate-mannose--protein O-mannosyl transferase